MPCLLPYTKQSKKSLQVTQNDILKLIQEDLRGLKNVYYSKLWLKQNFTITDQSY